MTYRAHCIGRRRRRHSRWLRKHTVTLESCTELLKFYYPLGPYQKPPLWAEIALKFGWMTHAEYRKAKPWPEQPLVGGITQALYEESPMFALLKKKEAP